MATLPANTTRASFSVEGTDLLVSAFEVRERISHPYQVSLDLASESEIQADDVIGKSAALTLDSDDGERYFHGVLSDFTQSGAAGRFFLYRARVVPSMALLALEQDVRIFQNKKVDAIIADIMDGAGISADLYDFRLQGTYPEREYCVQYRESDLDFISRLLETEGIFYFFEHSTDRHVMVFGDGTVNYQPISGENKVLYNSGGRMVAEEEAVSAFERTRRLHTGSYALQDYLFKNPALNLMATSKDTACGQYEYYDYPGGYAAKENGDALARVRLQQARIDGDVARGESNIARLVPGFTFTLSGHDIGDLNREYLVTEIIHKGAQPQVLGERTQTGEDSHYGNRFAAIPSTVTVRPGRTTPLPVVHGVHTAIVTGPSGEEIYTDEHGRVKIQFHWDRLGKKDEKSSCWIRVSQSWAGAGWGALFIPRIGQEVIVDFLEGNPDRPIITGSVYHGTNTPPYPLPDEMTKSTIKSETTKGGGGFNEIRFEDKKDKEEIFIHGQKDWTIAIENDKNQTVGHDETLTVSNNRTKTVEADQSESIGKNKSISVGKDHREDISENASVTIGKNETRTVNDKLSLTVGKSCSENIGENHDLKVGKSASIDIGENHSLSAGKDSAVAVGKNYGLTVEKKITCRAGQDITIESDKEIVFKTGSASMTMKKNGDIIIKGGKITIKGSKDLVLKGSKISEN